MKAACANNANGCLLILFRFSRTQGKPRQHGPDATGSDGVKIAFIYNGEADQAQRYEQAKNNN